MVQKQVKPITEGAARPPKGRMTWIALAAIILFAVTLVAVVVRPLLNGNDADAPTAPQSQGASAPAAVAG